VALRGVTFRQRLLDSGGERYSINLHPFSGFGRER
jgi:hypothetical protein